MRVLDRDFLWRAIKVYFMLSEMLVEGATKSCCRQTAVSAAGNDTKLYKLRLSYHGTGPSPDNRRQTAGVR